MTTSTCIRPYGRGVIITSIQNDKEVEEEKMPIWVVPIEHKVKFDLSYEKENDFLRVLHSNEGYRIVRELKNSKANGIINTFLENYRSKIGKGKSLEKFVDNVIKEPLKGENLVRFVTMGLTKKNIFDAFVKEGLIKI